MLAFMDFKADKVDNHLITTSCVPFPQLPVYLEENGV